MSAVLCPTCGEPCYRTPSGWCCWQPHSKLVMADLSEQEAVRRGRVARRNGKPLEDNPHRRKSSQEKRRISESWEYGWHVENAKLLAERFETVET